MRLALRQWSLAPNQKFEVRPTQPKTDSSGCFGINLCNEFPVELPSVFELFSYHIFKEQQRRNEIIGMQERYENEIKPFEGCNSAEVRRISERHHAEFNTIQEKYLNKSDGIEVPTSTNISRKDLRMKFLFNFDEENSTFRFSHQETNAQVQYIRGKIQL